jgi:serine/threonine protein kinase
MGSSLSLSRVLEHRDLKLKVKRLLGQGLCCCCGGDAAGGFAFVYLVKDVRSKKKYALKKILVQDKEGMQHAKAEMDLMASLPPHPNVVRCFSSHIHKKKNGHLEFFILMEFCDGGQLVDAIARRSTPPSEARVLSDFTQVCKAVAHLHSQLPKPIIHRDIKVTFRNVFNAQAENVLLQGDTLKLCDFGSATRDTPCATTPTQALLIAEELQK